MAANSFTTDSVGSGGTYSVPPAFFRLRDAAFDFALLREYFLILYTCLFPVLQAISKTFPFLWRIPEICDMIREANLSARR